MTMIERKLTANDYWTAIVKKINGDVQWNMAVAAHIRAKTGCSSPAVFHNNGAEEEEKISLYKEVLAAIAAKDIGRLQGAVAGGQAAVQPNPQPDDDGGNVPPIQVPPDESGDDPDDSQDMPEPIAGADPLAKLREALLAIGMSVDENAIRKIVHDELRKSLQHAVNQAVAEAVGKLRITIQ